jgi:hypothetical protein
MPIDQKVAESVLEDGPYLTCFYSASLLEVWGPVGDNTELIGTFPKAEAQSMCERLNAENRARRVLLAQAECVSDGAVDAAISALYPSYFPKSLTEPWRDNLRAAIAAALRFEAGE